MGRYSGDATDRRCNRDWGHTKRRGDFRKRGDPPPKYVDPNCTVDTALSDVPIVDENGEEIGPPPSSLEKPAFSRALPKEGTGLKRSSPIFMTTEHGTFLFNATQLQTYLMADDKQEALDELFDNRDQRRKNIQRETSKIYKDMYGTEIKVFEGAKELPPYNRGDEKIPLGIPQLDAALNGGLVPGVRMNISGQEDSGKTTLKNFFEGAILQYYIKHSQAPDNEQIARIVPEGYTLQYTLNAMNSRRFAQERGYGDPEFPLGAVKRVVDEDPALHFFNKHVAFFDTTFQEESMQSIVSHVTHDVQAFGEFRSKDIWSYDLPVTYRAFSIDSVDADELAEEAFDSKGAHKNLGKDARIATQARLLAEAFRKLYKASKVPITLIMISQKRTTNITSGFTRKSEYRGMAHPYFVDLGFDLWNNSFDQGDEYKRVHVVANKVHTDASIVEGDDVLLYLVPGKGFDPLTNSIKFAFDSDDINTLSQARSWVYYKKGEPDELKRQGSDPIDVQNWLRNEGKLDTLYSDLMAEMGYHITPEDSPSLVNDEDE